MNFLAVELFPFLRDPLDLSLMILFLPLTSFVVLFLLGHYLPRKGDLIATILSAITFLLSLFLFVNVWGIEVVRKTFPWIELNPGDNPITFPISIKVNDLSAMMLLLVSFIALLVHVYSLEYMKGKKHYERYYPYLGLFTFSMIGIVLSDNLLITFMFWELVGFSSYLLIGFWYEKEAAMDAAKKAFLYNRIGDTGFIIGIIAFYVAAGSFEIGDLMVVARAKGFDDSLFFFASLGLFLGCVGKSAQFPLQSWLPDAMEGPTPVSALIHAATMVAAGIYLLIKVHMLLHPDVLNIIAVVGALTAFLGAVPALFQNDIKKVLAFSTISQLGYMVMAIGVQAYEASFFHLMTHGFFKACLFLSAGSVIHAMHEIKHELFVRGNYRDFDSQDMRIMGGFRKVLPITFYCYLISSASLIGLPFFSGFLSKDAILEGALKWAEHRGGFYYMVPLLSFITVLITAAYMTRQLVKVFLSENRLTHYYPQTEQILTKIHDPSLLMKIPLMLLALLSLSIAFSFNPFSASQGWLFKVEGHLSTGLISTVLALVGCAVGYVLFKKSKIEFKDHVKEEKAKLTDILKNNWYLDQAFYYVLVVPGFKTAAAFSWWDLKIVDGFIHFVSIVNVVAALVIAWLDKAILDGIVNLIARIAGRLGTILKSIQNGKIQAYYIFALFMAIILLVWIIIV
jgi:NADH-quinone oxidoreductase subunit L